MSLIQAGGTRFLPPAPVPGSDRGTPTKLLTHPAPGGGGRRGKGHVPALPQAVTPSTEGQTRLRRDGVNGRPPPTAPPPPPSRTAHARRSPLPRAARETVAAARAAVTAPSRSRPAAALIDPYGPALCPPACPKYRPPPGRECQPPAGRTIQPRGRHARARRCPPQLALSSPAAGLAARPGESRSPRRHAGRGDARLLS